MSPYRYLVAEDQEVLLFALDFVDGQGQRYNFNDPVLPTHTVAARGTLNPDRGSALWPAIVRVTYSLTPMLVEIIEMPLDTIQLRRQLQLFSTGELPSMSATVRQMWQEHGSSAFYVGTFHYVFHAAFRSQLTLSPWLDQPLLIKFAIFTSVSALLLTPVNFVVARGPVGCSSLLSACAAYPPLSKVQDVLKRIPSLFPFLLADLFIYQLSMKCSVPLRFLPSYIALPTSTFLMWAVRTIPQTVVKLLGKRVMISDEWVSPWRVLYKEIPTYPLAIWVESLILQLTSRALEPALRYVIRTSFNRRAHVLTQRMNDRAAMRRCAP
jgi:hypothetical protein